MIVVELSESETLMLKQCLATLAQTNPELYLTAELLMSVILRAEQDNGR